MTARADSTEKQYTLEHHNLELDSSADANHESCVSEPGNTTDGHVDYGLSAEQQAKIMRRVDRRLVLTVGAMYCISLVDRTNMSSANIAGMSKELVLIDNRYNLANLVFFTTYIVFQPPSTVLVRAIGPRAHLAGITLLWGAVVIGMGFVQNWQQLTALRTVLGLLEAGFFPSYEVGKRYSVFSIVGCVAAAFSGVLAYGLMHLNGRQGLTGWRWIFIIEGALTCALAITCYWLLVDFPDSSRKSWKFLTVRERQWIVSRVEKDRGDAKTEAFQIKKFLRSGMDWKIWAYAMMFFGTNTMTYGLAYTLPLILVTNMGFSVGAALCLIAPPYVFAGFVMFTMGWLGDKYRIRGPIIVANMLLCLVGLPIMGWASSAGVRYFGVFLVTAGANSNVPCIMSFQANNVRGQWKRAFCSATLVGFGGIGGICGSLVFREQDKPTGYKPGLWACIACALVNVLLVGLCDWEFIAKNKKADRGEISIEDDANSMGGPYISSQDEASPALHAAATPVEPHSSDMTGDLRSDVGADSREFMTAWPQPRLEITMKASMSQESSLSVMQIHRHGTRMQVREPESPSPDLPDKSALNPPPACPSSSSSSAPDPGLLSGTWLRAVFPGLAQRVACDDAASASAEEYEDVTSPEDDDKIAPGGR
ncbi:hypothetical protein E4U21_006932 [Claviceps maximensis]|nr:hypothetical protein E4U21_006932 [Claviceps maximensis]